MKWARPAVRTALALAGVAMASIGLTWMLVPASLAPQFGLVADGAVGLNSLRGDFGGLFAGLGTFMLLGLRPGATGRAFLVAALFCLAYIMVGRAVGLVADGPTPAAVLALVVEAVLLLLCQLGLVLQHPLHDPRDRAGDAPPPDRP